MKKDEFTFLELCGNIEETYIDSALQPWKERGGQRRIYHLGQKAACLALIAMLGFCLAFHGQVYAAIKRFTTMIGEGLWMKKDLSPYTEIVGQTQTKNGVALTLNEVILDDYKLLMAFHVDPMEHENDLSICLDSGRTRINGIPFEPYGSGNGSIGDMETLAGAPRDILLSEDCFDLNLPEGETKLHVVVDVGGLRPQVEGDIDTLAEFVYDFTVTPDELSAQTMKKDLDLTIFAEDDRKFTLKKLIMNDLYCRIIMTGNVCDDNWGDYELKMKGEDSFGNPVSLFGVFSQATENETLFETDFWGDYEPGVAVAEDECQMSVPDKNCEYMDLQLYKRKIIWAEENTEESDTSAADEYAEFWSDIEDFSAVYSEENNYGWEPVGEKFRVMVK